MVAMALDAADLGEAVRYLDYLQAPWERAMPDDLAAAVAAPHDEPRMRRALDLARRHRLL
jgi:hypothetical protein